MRITFLLNVAIFQFEDFEPLLFCVHLLGWIVLSAASYGCCRYKYGGYQSQSLRWWVSWLPLVIFKRIICALNLTNTVSWMFVPLQMESTCYKIRFHFFHIGGRLCGWWRACTSHGLRPHDCSRQCSLWTNWAQGTTTCYSHHSHHSVPKTTNWSLTPSLNLQVGSFDAGYGCSMMARLVIIAHSLSIFHCALYSMLCLALLLIVQSQLDINTHSSLLDLKLLLVMSPGWSEKGTGDVVLSEVLQRRRSRQDGTSQQSRSCK